MKNITKRDCCSNSYNIKTRKTDCKYVELDQTSSQRESDQVKGNACCNKAKGVY